MQGAQPVNIRAYRLKPELKTEVERQIAEMLKAGIIQKSSSPFCSPIILVKKKDGTWRFCVDYRRLNDNTVKNKFPLPIVDELLDELGGAAYFSKIDLRAGYHQIRMREEDEEKTAFKMHHGHYHFRVMPFGLCNAPATFQALMKDLLRPYLRRFVLVFFDDILIFSDTWADHLQHVRTVFTVLHQHRLFVKRSKCAFETDACDTGVGAVLM